MLGLKTVSDLEGVDTKELAGVLVTGVAGLRITTPISPGLLLVKGDCDGVSEAPQTFFAWGKLEASAVVEGFSIGESFQPVAGRSLVFKDATVSLGLPPNQDGLP